MKKLYILFCLFLLIHYTAQSQTPVISWTYESPGGNGGLDEAFSIIETKDTGYMLAGRTGPVGINAGDFYFIKLDASGGFQWSKIYSGDYVDEIHGIVQSADGGYVATGVTVGFPDTSTANLQDMVAIKLDANGDTVWIRRFGGPGVDMGEAMDTSGDGGYMMVGRYGWGGSNNDFYLVRIDANGDSLWTKTYGGPGSDIANCVKHTIDGGYIIAGTTTSFGSNPGYDNIWLMKINAVGDTLWTQAIGGPNVEEGYSVSPTKDGGYILTGSTGATVTQTDVYVVKTDSLGNVEWTKTYGSHEGDLGRDIIQTSDGGYALTGIEYTTLGEAGPLLYVLKMDSAGNQEWATQSGNYNSPNGAQGYSIKQTADGGLVIAGGNDLGNGSLDNRIYVLKFAPSVATGILEAATKEAFIYPNPFSESAVISFPFNLLTNGRLETYNTNGQLVFSKGIMQGDGQLLLYRNTLPQGIYFYQVECNGGALFHGRFIVL